MKFCTHCGKDIMDEAIVCVGCGCNVKSAPTTATSKYCYHCGKELASEAVVCIHCGCSCASKTASSNGSFSSAVSQLFSSSANTAVSADGLLTTLSERMKIDAIIWIVIAALQIIGGIFLDWLLLIVGVANIVTAVNDLKYSKEVLENPSGIVAKFEPLVSPIIVLAYNLIIGGVIGVIGSIYYFIAVRGFVMANKDAFHAMDTTC